METDRHKHVSLPKAQDTKIDCSLVDCSCFTDTTFATKPKKKCCKKYKKKKGKNCKKCPRLLMN